VVTLRLPFLFCSTMARTFLESLTFRHACAQNVFLFVFHIVSFKTSKPDDVKAIKITVFRDFNR
ncbi:MAG: hypothetical protein RR357_05820, partial [Clostridia bacterium]